MQSTQIPYCKTIFLLLCVCYFCPLKAQVFTNDAGTREKHFIYEVKHIDEFFERFNNDTSSFIRKAYKTYHIKYNIDRPKLIKSLFNYETKTWDQAVIDNFVKDVTAPRSGKLNFMAEGWYAEARSRFQYNGGTIDIPIILRISTDNRLRCKWVIAAVKPGGLKTDTTGVAAREAEGMQKFINPVSHTTNFIELAKAFDDKEHLADYFEPDFFKRNNSLSFYNAILNNRATFLYVKDITYHFLQAGKWIFTVDYFPRESLNAGWLINSIRKASVIDKGQYLRTLLEEQ